MLPVKDWIEEEKPRELVIRSGADSAPLAKLLAVILRTGKKGSSAEELARELLNTFRSLRALDGAPISELCKINGVGPAKAAQVKAALEIGKRLSREKARRLKRIENPGDAFRYVLRYYGPYLRDAVKELFCIILLDRKNRPIHHLEISRGSVSASIVDPKEIIKEVSLRSASSVILVHNHPSGDVEPSADDLKATGCVTRACACLGVRVLDHIIIGKNAEDFFSFSESGAFDR
jgi:DNA repair protein RadC